MLFIALVSESTLVHIIPKLIATSIRCAPQNSRSFAVSLLNRFLFLGLSDVFDSLLIKSLEPFINPFVDCVVALDDFGCIADQRPKRVDIFLSLMLICGLKFDQILPGRLQI